MNFNWIKITDRARDGIDIINSLDYQIFSTVLDYVYKNMNPKENDQENDEPEDQLEQLENLVNLEKRSDFLLLIKTLSYILKRTSTIIMKPTKLQTDLREKLKISFEKVDAIIKLWFKTTKPIFDHLDEKHIDESELNGITGKLIMQFSSNSQQKENKIFALLQLRNIKGQPINLEMNHDELLGFYNQIENIQLEFDALRSK